MSSYWRGLGRKVFAATLLGVAFSISAAPIIRVIDGDTMVVRDGKMARHIRVANVDAPELRCAGGVAAREFARALCESADVRWQPVAIDRYHRTVAHVWCGDVDVARALRAAGHHQKRSIKKRCDQ